MSDLQIIVEEVNADGVITKISVAGTVEHYQHPDFDPAATYTTINDVAEITADGLYAIYATATQMHQAYRKQGADLTLLFEQGTGYEGYRSAVARFVDKTNFESVDPTPIVLEFDGTVNISNTGSIESVAINQSGIGYPATTVARITGDIVRAEATATVTNTTITQLNLIKPGVNYRAADTQVGFFKPETLGGGAEYQFIDAVLVPVFDPTDKVIQSIRIDDQGTDYPTGISLKFTNTRTAAEATATVVGGKLTEVNVTKLGTGYHPDTTTITFIDDATGLPISPLELPLVEPEIDAEGNLTGVTVVDQGQGIPDAITVVFDWGIPAAEAFATITVTQSKITAVNITNPGSGYRAATTQITIVRTATDQPLTREKAEYTAIIDGNGNLTGFNKIKEGSGYLPGVVVKITDNFAAAEVDVNLGIDGEVTGFTIVNPGSGYFQPGIELVNEGDGGPEAVAETAVATGVLRNNVLIGMEVLNPGLGYPVDNTAVLVEDKTIESCSPGAEAPNLWANVLGPDVYALAIAALTPEDPTFVRQEPVYDYCGRLVGYEEVVMSGDRAADGGNPFDGAVSAPLDLNYEFVWVNAPAEGRVGWGVPGFESEQLVGVEGAKKLTKALDLNPEITLYRGQSHILSIPSGLQQEFYIYETVESPTGLPVIKADGTTVLLKPNTAAKFSQGLHRFETGEYLDEANGRDENAETWSGTDLQGNPIDEPAAWRRQDLYPNGTNLLFQIGEGDPPKPVKGEVNPDESDEAYQLRVDEWKKNKTGLVFWPEFLAYSNKDGTCFGIFRLV